MSSRARRISVTRAVEPFDWHAVSRSLSDTVAAGAAAAVEAVAMAPRPIDVADEQARIVALEREAFGKGYAQGERTGGEAAAKRGEAMLRRLTETLEELGVLRAEMIRRTERQTVQLALAIAKRLIDREISLDRGLIIAMARAALDRLGEQASATVRLNPEDYAVVTSLGRELPSDQVRVVADPVVSRGGCLVQSDFGFMEIGIDKQFEELARGLLGDGDLDAVQDKVPEGHAVLVRS